MSCFSVTFFVQIQNQIFLINYDLKSDLRDLKGKHTQIKAKAYRRCLKWSDATS